MKHIIIGASAAGITAAKTLRQLQPDSQISLISKDTRVHSRCMLHKLISGERSAEEIDFTLPEFFVENRISWISGASVAGVDTAAGSVVLENGNRLAYDRLLIATGAHYVVPPIPNFREAKNVFGLRDIEDAEKIRKAAEKGKRCVVVGSGLVGLDAVYALTELGLACSVVEMADRLSPLQLDKTAADAYQRLFEKAGCTFYLGETAAGSDMEGENISAVILSGGGVLPCDFVIVAAGVRPTVEFLADSGIKTDRSVEVDEYLRTSAENVWAAGDAAGITGIWPNAMAQGELAARNMCGEQQPYIDRFGIKNTMNFYGLTTLSLGNATLCQGDTVLTQESRQGYRKIVLRNGVPAHVILQGDISNSGIWQELIKRRVDLSGFKKSLFSLSYGDFYETDPKTGEYIWKKSIEA